MEITDVRVRKITKEGKIKAIVSITFDHEFVVHDIKIIDGENGFFLAMPSRRTLEGEYRDSAHPIKASMRDRLQREVLNAYEEELQRMEQEAGEGKSPRQDKTEVVTQQVAVETEEQTVREEEVLLETAE